LFALQLAVVGAFVLVAGSGLERSQRWALLAALAFMLLLALGVILKALFEKYFTPLSRLTEEMALLAANPDHRITPRGVRELHDLADKINELATAHRTLRTEVQAKIAIGNQVLAKERNRLAALMSDLAAGVLVCNTEGRILLYNRRARQLLEAGLDAAPVGLGRSLFSVIERGLVEQALEQIRYQLRQRQAEPEGAGQPPEPTASFVAAMTNGHAVRMRLAPVLDEAGALDGFVLVFDEIDHGAETGGREEPEAAIFVRGQSRPVFYDFDLFQAGQDVERDQQLLAQIPYTVFDTETTGLQPAAGDEIIAVGAVRIINGRLLYQEYFDRLIRPRCPLSAESTAIHGITEAMLADQPRIEQVLPQFQRFAEDTVLVAHNAAFDMRFLQMQEEPTGVRLRQTVLDTLLLSQVIHPHQSEHSLEALASRLGVPIVGRHTALGDAIVTAEVFLRMLPLLAGIGIRTLGEAREAERRTLYARLRY
jgi:DNA polymerase III epsilon subunit family exonuclease